MDKPAAIMGAFADVQSIRTRSVAVLKIEIPIEKMDEALAVLGGWPQPGSEKMVAIALLVQNAKPVEEPKANASALRSLQAKETYASKDEMAKAVTRAALLCKDEEFQRYIHADSEDNARIRMYHHLDISSRADIGHFPDAHRAFLDMEADFKASQQVAGYSPAVTGQR